MLRISLVEDNAHLRELLVRQINRSGKLKCLAAYATAEEALHRIPQTKPDVVLMDIRLPKMDGIECTRRLRALLPRLNIIMLTEHEHTELIFEALKAGASGYLFRGKTTGYQLENAVMEAITGGSPITPGVARKMVSYFQQLGQTSDLPQLTRREQEVLECLVQGWVHKEIAARLGISVNTAKTHLRNIYRKLQARSKTEAVSKYLRSRPPRTHRPDG